MLIFHKNILDNLWYSFAWFLNATGINNNLANTAA